MEHSKRFSRKVQMVTVSTFQSCSLLFFLNNYIFQSPGSKRLRSTSGSKKDSELSAAALMLKEWNLVDFEFLQSEVLSIFTPDLSDFTGFVWSNQPNTLVAYLLT